MNDEQLNRIERKLDKIDSRVDNIDVTLAKQHVSLKEHIRRTEILEKEVGPLKEKVQVAESNLKFILKIIGLAVSLSAIVGAVIGVLEYLNK